MPVRMWRLVVEDPGAEEPAVGCRFPADRVEERTQSKVQPAQVIERNRREVVMLEVVSGVEIPEVPPARRLQDRSPLGRILGPDGVMLSEPVQSERARKDEKRPNQVNPHDDAD